MEDKFRAITDRDHGMPVGGRGEGEPERSSSVEWGAASLALGAVFAIMAPVALLLVYFLESTHYQGFGRTEIRLAALGGYAAALIIWALVIIGIVSGIYSMSASRQQRRSIALGLAGVLLNGLDLFVWLGAALAWHASVWNRL